MRPGRTVGFLTLVVSLSGCLITTYVGTYWFDNTGGSEVCAANLPSEMGQALADLGFAEVKNDREAWMKDRSAVVAQEFAQLRGASHLITVALNSDPTSVRIRDWDDPKETQFVRALRGRVEQCLRDYCDQKNPHFKGVDGDAWW